MEILKVIFAVCFLISQCTIIVAGVDTTTQSISSYVNTEQKPVPNDTVQIDIVLKRIDNHIINISWTPKNGIAYPSFVVSYYIMGKDKHGNDCKSKDMKTNGNSTCDSDFVFTSPELEPTTRSIIFYLPASQDVKICVDGMLPPHGKNCSDWFSDDETKPEEKIDIRKVASGISAGCVFLIPCIALLIFILRKDKQMKAKMSYEELAEAEQLNPTFSLKDEEKILVEGFKGSDGGKLGQGEKTWHTLSLKGITQLKKENGPTIYIHNGEVENEAGSYSVRL